MPTGAIRRAVWLLLDLARHHDFILFEDDYEFELNFLEPATPVLLSLIHI
mgnify:FL=1